MLLTILLFSPLTHTYASYPYNSQSEGKSIPPSVILSRPEDQAVLSPNVTFQYETTNPNSIRNASLYLNGVRNQTIDYLSLYYNDTDRIWSEKLKQRVNLTCPLTILYNEEKGTNTSEANPELLWGVILYKTTGNQTYLKGATEVASWLNETRNRQFLFFPLDTRTGNRAGCSTTGTQGYPILILAEMNASFIGLAEWYAKETYRIFMNQTTNLMHYSVDQNENPVICYDEIGSSKPLTFAYIYKLTGNETYKGWLKKWTEAFWSKRTAENITPGYMNVKDYSVPLSMVKEDQHFGNWLLNLEGFYYYTRDDYYKSIIRDVANAVSKWIWYPEKNRFRYYVIWNDPSSGSTSSVHGFSLLDMGMINAYLLWGNQTWLDYARRDYDELILKKKILSSHGLIYHAITKSDVAENLEASWDWNKHAVQAGYMLYLITKNQTYLDSIKALHKAVYLNQRGDRGYISKINADTLVEYVGAKSVSLGHIPHITYPNLLGDREKFGSAHVASDTFDNCFEEYGEMRWMNPKENFGIDVFKMKNLSAGRHTWAVAVFDAFGTKIESNQRSFFVGLDTLVVPSNYPTIQDAINNANYGDTIFVLNGVYYERVVINKTVILIGESREDTIIVGNETGTVLTVIADSVVIKGFMIRNYACNMSSAINLWNCSYIQVLENNINGDFCGIKVNASCNCLIANNIIQGIKEQGICLSSSCDNIISRNEIINTTIALLSSSRNIINENNVKLSGNIIAEFSSLNIIKRNNFESENLDEIRLNSSHSNQIYGNSIFTCRVIVENSSGNAWDNGYEGNYWNDYNGVDQDGDGVGDIPYIIDVNNQDNFPLVNPYLYCDVNHDAIVDLTDISWVIGAYSSTNEDHGWFEPYWYVRKDVNEDGLVDLSDICLVISQYGKSWSQLSN